MPCQTSTLSAGLEAIMIKLSISEALRGLSCQTGNQVNVSTCLGRSSIFFSCQKGYLLLTDFFFGQKNWILLHSPGVLTGPRTVCIFEVSISPVYLRWMETFQNFIITEAQSKFHILGKPFTAPLIKLAS